MPEQATGCAKPSKGPILETQDTQTTISEPKKEVSMVEARVGKPAPDFELTAFQGDGFKPVRLSDYKGKWIVVCFYPGDFTFV
jgi:cytochrome oxidase Cu insertion factor (SCO1/SenC/PrrC family)